MAEHWSQGDAEQQIKAVAVPRNHITPKSQTPEHIARRPGDVRGFSSCPEARGSNHAALIWIIGDPPALSLGWRDLSMGSHLMRLCAVAAAAFLLSVMVRPVTATEATVPILVYHRFDPANAGAMTVTTPVFAEQLAWLAERKIAVIRLHAIVDRLREGAPLPASAVALTADDGHRSVYTEMFPLIQRYHVPVTLFIYPSAISNADYALTWDQIREMLRSGLIDVQSHTYWHPNFHVEQARLPPPAYRDFVTRQLALSKSKLEDTLSIHVDLLAWPFGIYDAELERLAAEAGYVAAFTIKRARSRQGDKLFELPRYIVTDRDRGARFAALVSGPETDEAP